MTIRIVRLGSDRHPDEGPRIGTVRRPPRGVPKAEFARRNWYDTWYPLLSPSLATMKLAHAATNEAEWENFAHHYRTEMKQPEAARALDLLALLSQQTNFSVGCYCENEAHCHRSTLRKLLEERGAQVI